MLNCPSLEKGLSFFICSRLPLYLSKNVLKFLLKDSAYFSLGLFLSISSSLLPL